MWRIPRFSSAIALSTFGIYACFACVSVQAAEDDDEDSRLEEIVVTATRRETNVMRTPFSMQAFGESQLEEQNIFEVRDLYEFIPSLTLQAENGQTDHTIQMRGSGISSVGPDDGASALNYYVDDIPYVGINSQVAPPLDYFDVERVEVLRGPQGTSFGQDSAGGSIRIYTNKPDLEEFGFKVRGHVSNRSGVDNRGWHGSGVINVPVVAGKFGLRGGYTKSYDPGFGSVDGRPDIDNPQELDLISWRVKALWNVSDSIDVTFTHSVWETGLDFFGAQRNSTENGKLVMTPSNNRIVLLRFPDGIPDNSAEYNWTSLVIKADLGFAELTSSTGFLDAPLRQFNWGASPGVGILFDVPIETTTQEFRLVSTTDGPLQWLTGIYYQDALSDVLGIVDVDFVGFQDTYFSHTPRTSKALAIYGEISYQINDQWVVLGGLRFKDDDRVADNFEINRDPVNDTIGGSSGGHPVEGVYTGSVRTDDHNEFNYQNWNPRINVTYYPSDDAMVYFNAATAFRAPIFVRGQQAVDLELAGLSDLVASDGTEVTTVEVGTKWTLFDGQLQLEGAVAVSDWKDVPVGVSWEVDETGDGVTDRTASGPISGADAQIVSIEWHAIWRATDNLTFSYVGSHTGGEFTADKSNAPGVSNYPPALTDGNDLPNVSDASHSFNIRYTAPLFNTGWQFFGSTNLSYRSKPESADATSPDLIPAEAAWKNVGLTLGARKGPWSVDFSVSNLTDFDEPFSPGSSQTTSGSIARPRTVQLQFTYDGFN